MYILSYFGKHNWMFQVLIFPLFGFHSLEILHQSHSFTLKREPSSFCREGKDRVMQFMLEKKRRANIKSGLAGRIFSNAQNHSVSSWNMHKKSDAHVKCAHLWTCAWIFLQTYFFFTAWPFVHRQVFMVARLGPLGKLHVTVFMYTGNQCFLAFTFFLMTGFMYNICLCNFISSETVSKWQTEPE